MATLREMRQAADDEAWRIKSTQDMLVREKMREAPHAGQLAMAEIFAAIVRLIDRIASDPVILERLRSKNPK